MNVTVVTVLDFLADLRHNVSRNTNDIWLLTKRMQIFESFRNNKNRYMFYYYYLT